MQYCLNRKKRNITMVFQSVIKKSLVSNHKNSNFVKKWKSHIMFSIIFLAKQFVLLQANHLKSYLLK